MPALTRRQFTLLPGAMLAAQAPSFAPPAFAQFSSAVITRPIPSTGEVLPAIGFGTAEVFGVADAGSLRKATAVMRALFDNGGKLIDTASTYSDAELVLGDVIAPARLRDKLFIATELEAPDAEELKRSLNRLQTGKLDLLQLHNVRDPRAQAALSR